MPNIETIFDVDGCKVGVRNVTDFSKATYEHVGSLHLITFNGVNRIFFPEKHGAIAFAAEEDARRALEIISKGKSVEGNT